jgi:extradiol dioxygenase family protein
MIFHLAIPSRNLAESESFYLKIGANLGRKYKTHIVLDFFGHQLVCHKSDLWDRHLSMYPRHFGVIIEDLKTLKLLYKGWQCAPFLFERFFTRNPGKREEHCTFFLRDPSNNIIEFKWYKNKAAVIG